MIISRKPLIVIASAFVLMSMMGAAVYAKTKEDSAKKARISSTSDDSKTNDSHTSDSASNKEKKKSTDTAPSPAKNNVTPAPAPTVVSPPAVTLPGQILQLASWKLQLPVDTDRAGSPDEIKQPDLSSYVNSSHFFLNSQLNGVVFRAHAGGATTKNSSYPRSELREMTADGRTNASWSNISGTHTMQIRQAITHLPDVKNELVAAQIHDDSDDVIMIRLEGNRLFVESDGENIGDLDANYALGTIYTVKIVAEQSTIKVYYNDILKVTSNKNGSGYYFKAGCYTQTNTTKGDSADSYGEVTIYSLSVTHT